MTYTPPDLSLDVVLQQQDLAPAPPLDVVLCAPVIENVAISIASAVVVSSNLLLGESLPDIASLTINSAVNIDSSIRLSVSNNDSDVYVPPPLSATITLAQQLIAPPLPLNVVLCAPPIDESKRTLIAVSSPAVVVNSQLSINAKEVEPRYISLDSVIDVKSSPSFNVTEFVVGISVNSAITVKSSVKTHYDPNVFRGAQLDVSSDLQYSKLQGISKSGSFERGAITTQSASSKIEASKLLGTDNQAQFEANIKLTNSTQSLSERSKLIGTGSKHQGEYHKFLAVKNTLKGENAKLVGQSDWLSFEAMLARQAERKVQGEYSYLDAIMRHTSSEYSKLTGKKLSSLAETAKLPSWFTSYLPPPLWHTVILKQQLAAPNLPLDVVLCSPKSQSPRTKLSIAQSVIDVYGYLILTAKESDGTEPQPQTGVIFVTNSVSLVRSDDGREIKMLGFSVGIDSNSYAWSFSATVPLSELSKVDTAREQRIGVDFTCNGNLWRFILDDCSDSVSFGESSLTIKGKSRAMLLAHPYATHRGFKFDTAMSARQIAEAELNRNGVPSGFTLDWQLAGVNGWQVPANTYSYSNRTPINSLQWIAEAAGGFINADMSEDIIHVLAQYPVPSWEWAAQTPSIELPMSLITSRSRGRVNKPSYNGVLVYGENDNGVGALIKRTGTSGGYQPPMVTSDLMTDTAAAISRGKMILSDTGDIGNIGISMPLHSDFGVLKPSTIIGVNDGEQWVGMVRGTTITGRLSSNRALEIDQSIDVERHFDKEIV